MKKIFAGFYLLLLFASNVQAQVIEYSFRVEGVCGMCQERIQQIAAEQGKANSAHWDLDSKILTVEIDEAVTTVSAVKYYLAEAGHDNGDFTAPDEVYDNLHACCKYRDPIADGFEHSSSEESIIAGFTGSFIKAEGHIYAMNGEEKIPLIGANVSFEGSTSGTVTDEEGYFTLTNEDQHTTFRVSFIGYEDQVIELESSFVEVTMADGHQLETVEISYRKRSTEVSFVSAINVESISREELTKAACCNLSESFETNPSVDVSFSDAVTGTNQIQMLGLAGPYVQITRELIPDVRGLNSMYGLNTTPGPWIESIQLIKGPGSVVNGFESITGQINVELKKPDRGELLHVNGYASDGGRIEGNLNYRRQITENISSGLLLHAKSNEQVHDRNNDGFTDMPLERDFVIGNRWKFHRKKNLEGQFGVKYSDLNHEGGFHDHFSGEDPNHDQHWRMKSKTNRLEFWSKTGFIFPNRPEMSIGLQLSTAFHMQEAEFGFQRYNADEHTIYSNLIFQNIFNNGHIIRTGLSFQRDKVEELVDKASGFFTREESTPGVYAEYTWKQGDKWTIIPGLRYDQHNNYGGFFTPRIHAKYNLGEQAILRFVGGRGQRTASIFSENLNIFASGRTLEIRNPSEDDIPYGLEAEVAWNYGVSYSQGLRIAEKELVLTADVYRTQFENQIIVDYENPSRVAFYNLQGESYSNSVQVKLDYELTTNLDVRVAYRLFDVKSTYEGELLQRPLVSRHRAFINTAYEAKNDWHFDLTVNWRGTQRLPNTQSNPVEHRRLVNSPSYFLANAQISKRWGDKWDIYLGAENLFNYRQTDAVIDSQNAFGEFFDASIVWAPLFGRNIYVGFRYNVRN